MTAGIYSSSIFLPRIFLPLWSARPRYRLTSERQRLYALVPDALKLVLWMGAVDAPLVGVLIAGDACLARYYLPRAYRHGLARTLAMFVAGSLYFALGVCYLVLLLLKSL